MPIESIITDPRNGHVPEVDAATGERQGLVVVTRPLKTHRSRLWFFTNEVHGVDMNKNVTFAGTPVAVYTDNTEWTMTAIAGTWDFDQAVIVQGGTKAIDGTSTINSSTAQAAKGSDLTVASYVALTGYIYITGWASDNKNVAIQGWDTGVGAAVGAEVNIGDYVNTGLFNTWQLFAIPLADFSFTAATIDALRFRTISTSAGQPPNYYLDTIRFEETGEAIIYRVQPDLGTWAHVKRIRIAIVDDYVSTLADATLPNIPYDTILGVSSLAAGLLYQSIRDGEVDFSFPAHQVSDWMQIPGCTMDIAIGDASNTMITIEIPFEVPGILKPEDGDELRIVVQDNLSGLLILRVVASGFEEVRE